MLYISDLLNSKIICQRVNRWLQENMCTGSTRTIFFLRSFV